MRNRSGCVHVENLTMMAAAAKEGSPVETPGPPAPELVKLLEATYAAFNARDIEAVLACLSPEVDWPDMLAGRRVIGRQAVRAYWQRQFELIQPTVEPLQFSAWPGADVCVTVHQVVRDRQGQVLSHDTVQHVYTLAAGRTPPLHLYHPPPP